MAAIRNIALLLRLDYYRWRRGAQFSSELLSLSLSLCLWILVALSLPAAMRSAQIGEETELLAMLLGNHLLRWVSQNSPTLRFESVALLPVRRWEVIASYLIRTLLLPLNFIWLPALWPHWWLLGWFLLEGMVYLALWHAYVTLTEKAQGSATFSHTSIGNKRGALIPSPQTLSNGTLPTARVQGSLHSRDAVLRHIYPLLGCEVLMRLRMPQLRRKITNGLWASIMLIVLSILIRNKMYTDFAMLYTLTFPVLPVLSSRLGYEQTYLPLLKTRLRNLVPLYLAKYTMAVILLLPGIGLWLLVTGIGCRLLPDGDGTLDTSRLLGWSLCTALVLYPCLLLFSPSRVPQSLSSQITTVLVLSLPVFLAQLL